MAFPEYVYVHVPLLAERAQRMAPRSVPVFISKDLPPEWDVREGAPLPWVFIAISECLEEIRVHAAPDCLALIGMARFKSLDLADYDRAPREMLPLRCTVGVMEVLRRGANVLWKHLLI